MVVKTEVKVHQKLNLNSLFDGLSVYVGYPENSSRSDSDLTDAQVAFLNTNGTRINKASNEIKRTMRSSGSTYGDALSAYIRSKGEPRWHIPPRPFIEPALEKEMAKINEEFKKAILIMLQGKKDLSCLDRIGLLAKNAIQKFIRDYPANNLIPNAPSTIKNKGEDHPLKGKLGSLLSHVTWIVGK